ncbi:MAG: valine--tRNA ligase [Bacteroidales bacterium]|nr:valine--tRNA ligase [Bacteroidales bacterium]MDD2569539.1 valine--tRNA ligase [Bacteroidales bacterium]MDD2812011.1 valine--tRNA ligase [Bacteroidales bacterium]MDD3384817.1 valine--tRNA ligase [Bacteroidales bacterium]MDD3811203.1 valine--tRNA ligase [Bacteroidales bacterium]
MSTLEIPTKYDPSKTEDKWYAYWMEHEFFRSVPDEREPYTIVIPPPNVTGVLHMGHMLNNTIQDILVRRARMKGKNACWLPGTDHASIATEARVVAKLREQGIKKSDLSREEFMEHAWEWTHKHGGIILEQLKKLGASCDWDRTCFTMDPALSESVIAVFVDLYRSGYIYRGIRMVNWDPQAKTAISDEEVNYKEVNSKLYYVRYSIVGREGDYVTIATTRPETILGDTAVCVNPADPRYEHLKGCHVVVPMVNREVPVIFDPYVDMEFGTGALKITPAHDENDYRIGLDHQLEIIDIFNDDGTLSEKAGLFIGIDRFKARKLAVELLEKEGFLVKVEDYRNKVGYSERTDAVIEPKLSRQWFMRMQELAGPALDCVMNDDVQLIPAKFKNTYRHWMENIKDWCISRQLWWGHRIPAWYLPDGQVVVSFNEELALAEAREITGNEGLLLDDLTQDEDVLDTWFSSWLWPISVFDGIRNPDNPDIKYYYPTNDLITAPEILFFWVARMIIAGHEFMGEKPFRNVYLTGIVRDGQRRKMSKSLGNSPEPLELIAKYGADGVRVGMLLCSPAGNDLLFDNSLTEQGRNFGNKIWNAFRLVSGWRVDPKREQPETSKLAASLFSARLNQDISILEDHFGKYRLSDALMTVYKLFWDDFSSWYLEMIKPGFGEPVDPITMAEAKSFFEKMMLLLHPFMPFITEEIWQHIGERKPGDSIMIAQLPDPKPVDEAWIVRYDQLKEVAVFIRSVRAEKNISPKTSLSLHVVAHQTTYDPTLDPLLIKLLNINKIAINGTQPEGCSSQIIRSIEYFVPFDQPVDVEEELARIRKEIDYTRGFLQSVEKKLANDRFLSHASPQVVDLEKKKWADANAKLTALTDTLERLLGAEER